MIKAILIDIDDTILDFKKSSKKAFINTIKDFNLTYKDEYFSYFEQINSDLWRDQKLGKISIKNLFKKRSAMMIEYLGLCEDNNFFTETFSENLSHQAIFVDGIEDLLSYLNNKYKLYAASNSVYKRQVSRLKKANLYNFFDGIFVSDTLGYEKPDGKFFEKIIDQIDFNKNEVIMIGDSLKSDIVGAKNAQIKSIWFSEKDTENKIYNYKVKNLSEIKKIL
ncbi:YjjG family noncanonical pyrimidine nucleotidase [Anaerococcus hydrogenalis]|uniref:YjjG family noncanonical pyrimidine nucleotidase n=1 Tax=Anaerococcus hydrogenalis TaxID=33029 RepID=UPI001D50F4F9|nr:YjjG family noncanonical pyrimidine nucleotidase [Anaerococcus hydrogenalis]MBS5989038.1 YjjG family noncanonical pyrimidine nucleotidase [Anaerococcus hydrogenalis]